MKMINKRFVFFIWWVGTRLIGQGIPCGDEFLVNTCADNNQWFSEITSLPQGGFAVCWHSNGQDGDGDGAYGQLFSSNGGRIGNEFRVNARTENDQSLSGIASLSNGGFVVCWVSDEQNGVRRDVFGQIFSPDGKRIGNEIEINTFTQGDEFAPIIESLSNNGFVICWSSLVGNSYLYEHHGQAFSSDGRRIGGDILIHSGEYWSYNTLGVASISNGGFVFCWENDNETDPNQGIFGQMFSSDGNKVGDKFLINSTKESWQGDIRVKSLSNGGFLVCWTSSYQKYGQVFSSGGTKLGGEFVLGKREFFLGNEIQISSLANGDIVICWVGNSLDGSNLPISIFGQIFSPDGGKIGGEFRINSCTKPSEGSLGIASLTNGNFMVCLKLLF